MAGANQQVVDETVGHFEQKLRDWSQQVKIKAGWICQHPGCGELERELLESHHIKPVNLFPALMYEVDNGKCFCMWHHAWEHKDNQTVFEKILARLCLIIYPRFYEVKK